MFKKLAFNNLDNTFSLTKDIDKNNLTNCFDESKNVAEYNKSKLINHNILNQDPHHRFFERAS